MSASVAALPLSADSLEEEAPRRGLLARVSAVGRNLAATVKKDWKWMGASAAIGVAAKMATVSLLAPGGAAVAAGAGAAILATNALRYAKERREEIRSARAAAPESPSRSFGQAAREETGLFFRHAASAKFWGRNAVSGALSVATFGAASFVAESSLFSGLREAFSRVSFPSFISEAGGAELDRPAVVAGDAGPVAARPEPDVSLRPAAAAGEGGDVSARIDEGVRERARAFVGGVSETPGKSAVVAGDAGPVAARPEPDVSLRPAAAAGEGGDVSARIDEGVRERARAFVGGVSETPGKSAVVAGDAGPVAARPEPDVSLRPAAAAGEGGDVSARIDEGVRERARAFVGGVSETPGKSAVSAGDTGPVAARPQADVSPRSAAAGEGGDVSARIDEETRKKALVSVGGAPEEGVGKLAATCSPRVVSATPGQVTMHANCREFAAVVGSGDSVRHIAPDGVTKTYINGGKEAVPTGEFRKKTLSHFIKAKWGNFLSPSPAAG